MKTADGWVMVSPLASKPSDTSVDAWLTDTSNGANLNTHVAEQSLTLNGLPALKVRYSTADGQAVEDVYVASGTRTFSMAFSPDQGTPVTPLEMLRNYAIYMKMLNSFRVEPR